MVAPQRVGEETKARRALAPKIAVILFVGAQREPFLYRNDQTTFALGKTFAQRNGHELRRSLSRFLPLADRIRQGELSRPALSDLVGEHLQPVGRRFSGERVLTALCRIAEACERLEQDPEAEFHVPQLESAGEALLRALLKKHDPPPEEQKRILQRFPALKDHCARAVRRGRGGLTTEGPLFSWKWRRPGSPFILPASFSILHVRRKRRADVPLRSARSQLMSLQRDCYAVLGRLARRLRERHRLQMKTIAAAVLDDLPQYRVEVHVGNEGPVVSVDTRPD